jgi:hypothetical protein
VWGSIVDLILNQLNQDFVDLCSATTHVQNLSTRIKGLDKRIQRKMVVHVLAQISEHLKSNCVEGVSLINSAFANPNMKYASYCEYIPDNCSFIEQFLTFVNQFSEDIRMSIPLAYYQLPVSVYRFYQTKKDLIVEYAKTHYEVPVDFDANRITLSIFLAALLRGIWKVKKRRRQRRGSRSRNATAAATRDVPTKA